MSSLKTEKEQLTEVRMRTLLASVFAAVALAGCATGPYDYGYGGAYYDYGPTYYGYYDTAPAYYGYYGYNRYYYSPGYYGGVVVNRFSDQRFSTRDRAVASVTPRGGNSHTVSRSTPRADRQANRDNAKHRRSVASTRSNDHGS